MKETIIKSLKQLVTDRYLLILVALMILIGIISATAIGLSIHPSERQLVAHYSAFGQAHFYLSQWFYLFVFVAFVVSSAVLHAIITIKLLIVRGHSLAVMYAWLGIGIILLGWIMASKILDLQALL